MPRPISAAPGRLASGGAIAAAALAGAVLRCAVVFTQSPDCLYHLRRAVFAARFFPKTILFDPMIRWPGGGICIWPPLFDLALALPARLMHGAGASVAQVVAGAQWVPVAFAAAAIAAAGWAGASVAPRWGGPAAAFVVALCPGHIQYSQLGHTDQHVAESFFGFLLLAAFLSSARRARPGIELLAGASLSAAVLTWQGAIFWAGLLAAALAAAALGREAKHSVRRAFLVLGLPALAVAAATALWTKGVTLPLTYVSFGPFQPLFLSALFGAVCLLLALRPAPAGAGRPRRALALAGAVAGLAAPAFHAAALAGAFAMGLRHLLSRSAGGAVVGGGLLSYSRAWLAQIVEYRPLLADGALWPVGALSLSFFLSPVALVFWGRRVRRGGRPVFHATLFFWGLFTLLWTLSQRRNIYYASLLSALAAVELARSGAAALARRRPAPARRRGLAAAGIVAGLSLPMLAYLPVELRQGYRPPPDQLAVMGALRAAARSPLDPYDPRLLAGQARPAALSKAPGVLAWWSQGHAVTFFAGLPVVADNFGYGYFDSLRFFYAESEEEALAIARRDHARLVETMDILPLMEQYAASLSRSGYVEVSRRRLRILPRYYRTLQARLQDFAGGPARLPDGTVLPALSHFRLLWSSSDGMYRGGRFVPRFRVFEVTGSGAGGYARP